MKRKFGEGRRQKSVLVVMLTVGLASAAANAETVFVKYRGPVDLAPFKCQSVTSSFINRICYDEPHSYMLIQLRGTWYHYCGIYLQMVAELTAAPSIGSYYNANVKGRFDCRVTPAPQY